MDILLPVVLFVVGFILGALIIWQLKKTEADAARRSAEEIEASFGHLSRQALFENQHQFLELAQSEFAKLQVGSGQQLDQKKELIDSSLQTIHRSLKDLGESTAGLREQIQLSRNRIDNLNETTDQLRLTLSNSQARGQWGERLVEDILSLLGMMEGKNYSKQSKEGDGRPDFTFNLPKEKRLNMDVKFPITHYEKYLASKDETIQAGEKKQFLTDVRNHVNAVAKRSYIDPAGGTVDFVLLFIPNESIYSFINQEDHELIDFAMKKQIVLCSPLTLYAILSLIRQSVASFAVERKAGDLQKLVQDFSIQWEKYSEKIDALGKTLFTVNNHYDQLKTTRASALERPMRKILDLKLEQQDESPPAITGSNSD
ncbi:MAG: DNA recombination protein RmuC [Verrucomicrobia subdivision 3 bacterium]|nr:DNA recombination protein RmuC [Limisphaerales bacterium]